MSVEEAITALELHCQKAESDLQYISHKLEAEYAEKCANQLLQRLKRIQEELPILRSDCENIVAAKQDLVEACRALYENRQVLKRIQMRAGIDLDTEETQRVSNQFDEMCYLWNKEAISYMIGNKVEGAGLLGSDDLNGELLKSNVQGLQMAPRKEESTQNSNIQLQEVKATPAEPKDAGETKPKFTRSPTTFAPITQEEFESVSELSRGRTKLEDVNKVYEALFNHFKSKRQPVEPISTASMVQLGCKITGQTGEARLATLRALKIIEVNKKGVVLKGLKSQ